jgi:hypothetical protein
LIEPRLHVLHVVLQLAICGLGVDSQPEVSLRCRDLIGRLVECSGRNAGLRRWELSFLISGIAAVSVYIYIYIYKETHMYIYIYIYAWT